MTSNLPTDLVSPLEAAKAIGVSRRTFYRYLQFGKLPSWSRMDRVLVSLADALALVVQRPARSPVSPPLPRAKALRDAHTRQVLEAAGFKL